jgi:hypothetical protein
MAKAQQAVDGRDIEVRERGRFITCLQRAQTDVAVPNGIAFVFLGGITDAIGFERQKT